MIWARSCHGRIWPATKKGEKIMTSITYNGIDPSKPVGYNNFRSAYIVFKTNDEVDEADANYIVDTL